MPYDFMFVKIRNSIVFRIGALLTAMTIMAVLSMFSSYVISEMADSDAAAINISGSLRKQSYHILSEMLARESSGDSEGVHPQLLEKFEATLSDPVLLHGIVHDDQSRLNQAYEHVVHNWKSQVKPVLTSFHSEPDSKKNLINEINGFVDEIDLLVYQYQKEAESKIEMLRLIQVFALFITLILVYVAMTSIHVNIEKPLKQMTESATRVRDGDLSTRVEIENKDELGILADAFNSMSDSLSEMYADLENRVEEKTKELQRSNDSLKLLYETARAVNEASDDEVDFQPILNHVSKLTGIGDMDLCMSTPESYTPYIHVMTVEDENSRLTCDGQHCHNCAGESCFVTGNAERYQVKFPLVRDDQNFGVLVARMTYKQGLESWQHQLIQGVADQIAVALSLKNQVNQDRRVALLNERTIIARELHDSLAQSLSYLKIQVTRLQKAQSKGVEQVVFEGLIDEIRDGLASAYRQLRELLATFRLQIDGSGLKGALKDAIKQLQSRTNMEIHLKYEIDSIPLTPNEEIHVLQICKEALQNATHHSRGSEVNVSLVLVEGSIQVSVTDDGVGITDDPEKLNHYGLAIMKERSKHLRGEFNLQRREGGGTEASFVFSPEALASQQAALH